MIYFSLCILSLCAKQLLHVFSWLQFVWKAFFFFFCQFHVKWSMNKLQHPTETLCIITFHIHYKKRSCNAMIALFYSLVLWSVAVHLCVTRFCLPCQSNPFSSVNFLPRETDNFLPPTCTQHAAASYRPIVVWAHIVIHGRYPTLFAPRR